MTDEPPDRPDRAPDDAGVRIDIGLHVRARDGRLVPFIVGFLVGLAVAGGGMILAARP